MVGKILSTTKQMKFIDIKKFAKMGLDKDSKIFVIYIATFKTLLAKMIIYFL